MARRLVEYGVPYVTINYQGWDTHKDHFPTMRRKLPEMDKGMATLLQDIPDRNSWTPRRLVERRVWQNPEGPMGIALERRAGALRPGLLAVLAGGGFKGGHVVGASDAKGEQVKERPVYPCDLIGSMYELLGIDCDAKLPHPEGLAVYVTPRAEDGVKMGDG